MFIEAEQPALDDRQPSKHRATYSGKCFKERIQRSLKATRLESQAMTSNDVLNTKELRRSSPFLSVLVTFMRFRRPRALKGSVVSGGLLFHLGQELGELLFAVLLVKALIDFGNLGSIH
jgi:hypothetical protein